MSIDVRLFTKYLQRPRKIIPTFKTNGVRCFVGTVASSHRRPLIKKNVTIRLVDETITTEQRAKATGQDDYEENNKTMRQSDERRQYTWL